MLDKLNILSIHKYHDAHINLLHSTGDLCRSGYIGYAKIHSGSHLPLTASIADGQGQRVKISVLPTTL